MPISPEKQRVPRPNVTAGATPRESIPGSWFWAKVQKSWRLRRDKWLLLRTVEMQMIYFFSSAYWWDAEKGCSGFWMIRIIKDGNEIVGISSLPIAIQLTFFSPVLFIKHRPHSCPLGRSFSWKAAISHPWYSAEPWLAPKDGAHNCGYSREPVGGARDPLWVVWAHM